MITVVQQPEEFTPSDNPVIWQIESDNITIISFHVEVIEPVSGAVMFTGDFDARPDYPQGTIIQLNRIVSNFVDWQVDNDPTTLVVPLEKPVISYLMHIKERGLISGVLADLGPSVDIPFSLTTLIEDVYQENVEWTGSSNATSPNFAYTTTPQSGTNSFHLASFTDGQYVKFVKSSTINAPHYSNLKMWVKINSKWLKTAYDFSFTHALVNNGDGTQTMTFNYTSSANEDTGTVWFILSHHNGADIAQISSGTLPITITYPLGDYDVTWQYYIIGGATVDISPRTFINSTVTTPIVYNHGSTDFEVSFYKSASVASTVCLGETHGFNRNILTWQELTFPLTDFSFTTPFINTVYIQLNYGNADGLQIDNVTLEQPSGYKVWEANFNNFLFDEYQQADYVMTASGLPINFLTSKPNYSVVNEFSAEQLYFLQTGMTNTTTPETRARTFLAPTLGSTGTVYTTTVNDPVLGVTTISTYTQVAGDTTAAILIGNIISDIAAEGTGYTATPYLTTGLYVYAKPGLGSTINGNYASIQWGVSSGNGPFSGGIDGTTTGLSVIIKTYDSLNTLVNTYTTPIADLSTNMQRIQVSPKVIQTIFSDDFTGVAYYTVYVIDGTPAIKTEVRTYYYKTTCNIDPVNLLWINDFGGLDSYQFVNVVPVSNINRNTIQKNPYKFTGGLYSNKTGLQLNDITQIINVNKTATYTAYSKFVTDREAEWLNQLFISKQVWVELSKNQLVPVMVQDTSYAIQKQKLNNTAYDFIQVTYTYSGDIIPAVKTLTGLQPEIIPDDLNILTSDNSLITFP